MFVRIYIMIYSGCIGTNSLESHVFLLFPNSWYLHSLRFHFPVTLHGLWQSKERCAVHSNPLRSRRRRCSYPISQATWSECFDLDFSSSNILDFLMFNPPDCINICIYIKTTSYENNICILIDSRVIFISTLSYGTI